MIRCKSQVSRLKRRVMTRFVQGIKWMIVIVAGTAFAASASAQITNQSYSFGVNLGTLKYTQNVQSLYSQGVYCGTITTYYNFVYISAINTSQSIPNQADFYNTRPRGSCPVGGYNGFVYTGPAYTISVLEPPNYRQFATINVQGYVNPKYIVVGVIYAPPGHKSTVDYTNSNLVSSTVTTKHSLSSSYSLTNAVLSSFNFTYGWKNGSVDSSAKYSNQWTQSTTTTDSTAVTIQKTAGTSIAASGPLCDYCGVDHDYDLIGVWVNPVALFTLTNNGVVQPNGYGFSTWDQPGLDVWYVYAGELNGDFAVRPSTTTEFARSWASGFVCPSGQGPGLTAQDEQTILQMDPYWNCTYKSPVNDVSGCPEPPSTTLYTQSTNASYAYQQPIPGGQPLQRGYNWNYTTTSTFGTDVAVTSAQTFSLENVFALSFFGVGFQDTLTQSSTISSTYETSSQFTSSNTSTAAATIVGPACNVVNGSCGPVYPPANAYDPVQCTALQLPTAFGQGDNFYIYQDNLFGTFMFEPYGQ
jgi:hypothetical protein